jgi:phage-related protein
MDKWIVIFYPDIGENNSPIDFLHAYCTKSDYAHITAKLELLATSESKYWQYKWLKKVGKHLQIRQGDFRIYFHLKDDKLVVIHACRKRSQETDDRDLALSDLNWDNFIMEYEK